MIKVIVRDDVIYLFTVYLVSPSTDDGREGSLTLPPRSTSSSSSRCNPRSLLVLIPPSMIFFAQPNTLLSPFLAPLVVMINTMLWYVSSLAPPHCSGN